MFRLLFSTFISFHFLEALQHKWTNSISLRQILGKISRAFFGLWSNLFWFWNQNKLLHRDWGKFSIFFKIKTRRNSKEIKQIHYKNPISKFTIFNASPERFSIIKVWILIFLNLNSFKIKIYGLKIHLSSVILRSLQVIKILPKWPALGSRRWFRQISMSCGDLRIGSDGLQF